MADTITIEECITRLDAIRHEIVSNSRDHFALSAGIAALYELESSHTVNRWISVEDALPEKDTDVIVCCYGSDMISAHDGETIQDAVGRTRRECVSVTVGFIGSDGWYGADWFPMMVTPTYWMPLPEPPEGGETSG